MIKKRQRHFDLEKAFRLNDVEFCAEWGFEYTELLELQRLRKKSLDNENENLWQYVHYNAKGL